MHGITLDSIRQAARRIQPHVHHPPVVTSRFFDGLIGTEVYFKCENFQKVGAFKIRGACNAVFSLATDDAARGVVTHSSGNHGQAVALAAKLRGIEATVVVPRNAPEVKRAAIQGYGAKVIPCEPNELARHAGAAL